MPRMARKKKAEPTIALINIVFLMLIFFLVAGTLAQPLDGALKLIETGDLEGREPPDALVLHASGDISYRGAPMEDVLGFTAGLSSEDLAKVKIVPDRSVNASRLVEVSRNLRAAGAQSIIIVTERAIK